MRGIRHDSDTLQRLLLELSGIRKHFGGEGLLDDMKAGVIDALVVQNPHKIGYEAVKTIVDKLNGKTPSKRLDLGAKVNYQSRESVANGRC